jgi:hypothetical protein
MTLAVLLSLCIFCSGPATVGVRPGTQTNQDSSQVKPADSSAPAAQSTSAPQPNPPAPPASSTSTAPKAPAAARHKPQNKAKNTAPCKAAADAKSPPKTSQSDPAMAASSESATSSATGSPSADLPPCPPPKVVVRNGGTAEGTVQLTGGTATAKNSPQRANTERLLLSTEDELKTTAGHPLDSSQQETVKQIHEYQAQSKTALQAGDLELAHNLAVKAHLLADQLVKPQP